MPSGFKRLSNEQEKFLIEEYRKGVPVEPLLKKYGFKTQKSITDKIKKHYPDHYDEYIKEAIENRREYYYKLEMMPIWLD